MKTKKGFYFTVMILFCIILLMSLSFEYRKNMTSDALRTRILTSNNFIKGIERDASRAVYISGYRTMIAITDYVAVNYKYLNETMLDESPPLTPDQIINHAFAESLFNGTLKQTLGFNEVEGLLTNATLRTWQEQTIDLSHGIGLNISFIDPDPDELIVHQTSPWFVEISIPMKYNISDSISGVTWNRNTNITAFIPIMNTFEDPYYIISFGAGCGNKILTNDSVIITEPPSCDMSDFLDSDGSGSRYIHSVRAPSYLNRLKGNISGFRDGIYLDPNGIESLIDTSKVSSCLQLPINDASTVVDFRYGIEPTSLKTIDTVGRIKLGYPEDIMNYSIYGGCYN